MMKEAVIIDGSFGEGGGQVLRSSLSLSMITGRPFKIKNIRAGRNKPGLMRQHLTCVKAAAEVCGAKVTGATIGSQEVTFIPQEIKGGEYHFAIGTAGSTMLLAQTLLPALMMANEPSSITLEGGTHNPHAPTYDFIKHSFLPALGKMGVVIESEIHRYGFYPAGGGKVSFEIAVSKPRFTEFMARGENQGYVSESLVANVPYEVAQRELAVVGERLSFSEESLRVNEIKRSLSPGNVIHIILQHENVTETIIEFGTRGVKAETVAKRAADNADEYLASGAVVGQYLADQLLLPMALAGGGKFTTCEPSLHTKTNIEVIQNFLLCDIGLEQMDDLLWKVTMNG